MTTLDLSLGEFEALAAKALRGAGYTWGIAADGAHAARVLARNELPAADILARLIDHVDGEQATDACPLTCGAAAADLGGQPLHLASVLDGRTVIEPLLLAPFLRDCRLDWATGHVVVRNDAITMEGEHPSGATSVQVTSCDPADSHQAPAPPATRASVSGQTYTTLVDFAGRTYAPATEESRNAGAG